MDTPALQKRGPTASALPRVGGIVQALPLAGMLGVRPLDLQLLSSEDGLRGIPCPCSPPFWGWSSRIPAAAATHLAAGPASRYQAKQLGQRRSGVEVVSSVSRWLPADERREGVRPQTLSKPHPCPGLSCLAVSPGLEFVVLVGCPDVPEDDALVVGGR